MESAMTGKDPAEEGILRDVDAVVFDFDGTLAVLNIDFTAMRGAVRRLAADFGIPPEVSDGLYVLETVEAGTNWMARSSRERAEEYRHQAMALITEIEIRAARGGSLFEGVRELLSTMKERNIRTAIITRNCGAAVTLIFPDIADRCDAFLPREAAGRVKPDPRHVLDCLEQMRVTPARSVVVGDHPMDIRMGRSAGTRSIGVLSGSSSREDLTGAGADRIIPSVTSILTLLR